MSDDARYADLVAVEGGSDNITLLLAAVEETDGDPGSVLVQSDGTILAPADLVKKAKLKPIETEEPAAAEDEDTKTTRGRRTAQSKE